MAKEEEEEEMNDLVWEQEVEVQVDVMGTAPVHENEQPINIDHVQDEHAHVLQQVTVVL